MSMRVRIENVTASVNVGDRIVREALAGDGPDGGVKAVFHHSVSVTVQVYGTGNVVSTGARSTREARESICETLAGMGTEVDPGEVEIRDIMASSSFDGVVDLDRAYVAFGESAEYDPEWFTGVIVHLDPRGCTGVVYSSGKIVISGCRDMDAVYDGLARIVSVLSQGSPRTRSEVPGTCRMRSPPVNTAGRVGNKNNIISMHQHDRPCI